jgi:hypothetical protein
MAPLQRFPVRLLASFHRPFPPGGYERHASELVCNLAHAGPSSAKLVRLLHSKNKTCQPLRPGPWQPGSQILGSIRSVLGIAPFCNVTCQKVPETKLSVLSLCPMSSADARLLWFPSGAGGVKRSAISTWRSPLELIVRASAIQKVSVSCMNMKAPCIPSSQYSRLQRIVPAQLAEPLSLQGHCSIRGLGWLQWQAGRICLHWTKCPMETGVSADQSTPVRDTWAGNWSH